MSDSTVSRITDKERSSVHSERMAAKVVGGHLRGGIFGSHSNHVRSEGQIVKKAVYIVIGISLEGKKGCSGNVVRRK